MLVSLLAKRLLGDLRINRFWSERRVKNELQEKRI
ncbi:hypothetical protein HCH_00726 [Hahella chejuensis KCTC 2396]|uniref:Uncharacterized protein n=1 Tax=Hahella chejuensis (strain KCTC 2396) TaxID=349521 RepID=Q2SP00_HAHCH|nr:hypothetical protein HCH_00726 [Hahella chejuensis KCTC 2396]